MQRDLESQVSAAPVSGDRPGRSFVAAIGIDRYASWPRLGNAVGDAQGAMRLFTGLGFTAAAEPLLNEAATAEAMRRLVTETLVRLAPEDSLVMFFAGHGYTRTSDLGNVSVKTGYVIPVDATEPQGWITANWLRLDGWLSDIARLPARHILVLIDACHSGVALNMEHKWRAAAARPAEDRAVLARRRSRQVITSALDDQRAMDGGPYPGHSLFTGCLIEAFSGGLVAAGEYFVTGSEIGQYLKRRVAAYPPMTQTPDVGAFELDDRGDLVILVSGTPAPAALHDLEPPAPAMTEWKPEGGAEFELGSSGQGAPDRDDQSMFWAGVEQALDPPTTTRGARTRRFQSNRHGAFAGNVRLGVVANTDGAMRVHLWSTHRDRQLRLQAIERDLLAGSMTVPAKLGPLRTRPAPKGEILYLEFAWRRNGSYLRELDRVKACILWFVGAVKNRFQ